jgi:hypothetical protein
MGEVLGVTQWIANILLDHITRLTCKHFTHRELLDALW